MNRKMTTRPMNTRIKELWVKALRSGEYPQDNTYLRTSDGYCCLGVLCDLAVQENVIHAPLRYDDAGNCNYYWYGEGDDQREDVLPDIVSQWAGLETPGGYPENNPIVGFPDNNFTTLAELNDTHHTFAEIADIIENNL